jgi:hypothetical protein
MRLVRLGAAKGTPHRLFELSACMLLLAVVAVCGKLKDNEQLLKQRSKAENGDLRRGQTVCCFKHCDSESQELTTQESDQQCSGCVALQAYNIAAAKNTPAV